MEKKNTMKLKGQGEEESKKYDSLPQILNHNINK